MRACVCASMRFFCFLVKRKENRTNESGCWGKKENFDTSSHGAHICNAAYVHQLQLTFYLSELPITRISWFFFSLAAVDYSSKFMLTSTHVYIYIYIYTCPLIHNNNERYQKWFFPGIRDRIIFTFRKNFQHALDILFATVHHTKRRNISSLLIIRIREPALNRVKDRKES
jgi:hypothetical protein